MLGRLGDFIDWLGYRRALRRWSRAADQVGQLDLAALRSLRQQARQLKRRLDRVIYLADGRLARPLAGSTAIRKPLHTDWAYRPECWRGSISPNGLAAVKTETRFGDEATIHHDCPLAELTLRQTRNSREEDLAPYALRLEAFRFEGTFLSLVIDLPLGAVQGLLKKHLFRLDCLLEMERPQEVFARLNIRHGPNTEQVVRSLQAGEAMVEFDLAYTKINEKRVERIWLDLIFNDPAFNQIILRDVTLTRRPRAEL